MPADRQREYETVYIMRPGAGDDDTQRTRERVEGIVENAGGHVLRFDDWGMRSTSYEIRDRTDATYHERGIYQYYRYMVPPSAVAEIERNLRILDPVLKYLTVKLEEDLLPEERLNKPTEEEAFDVTSSGEEE